MRKITTLAAAVMITAGVIGCQNQDKSHDRYDTGSDSMNRDRDMNRSGSMNRSGGMSGSGSSSSGTYGGTGTSSGTSSGTTGGGTSR